MSSQMSSCRALTLKDRVLDGSVEFDDDGWKVVQRAVAMELLMAQVREGTTQLCYSEESERIALKIARVQEIRRLG